MERQLTIAQHNRLDAIDEIDPAARVVGWDPRIGPIVKRGAGHCQAIALTGHARSLFGQPR